MEKRNFTPHGPQVSPIGFGGGHIGSPDLSEDHVGELLNRVVDAGVNLIDTARGYGLSEERIGRHLSWRRRDYLLSTKVGYGIPGYGDWTYDGILKGVETALNLTRTDHLDVVHLHSCPVAVLQQGEVIRALHRCRQEKMIGRAAYSGENDELRWALHSGAFDSLQFSVNVADQRVIREILPLARDKGIGVIAKRPLANAPWRFREQPVGNYCETYWLRLRAMGVDHLAARAGGWPSAALRFTAFTPGVGTCIVGSANWDHLQENLAAVAAGPLPEDIYEGLRQAFDRQDQQWIGQI